MNRRRRFSSPTTIAELLYDCKAWTGGDATFTWVPAPGRTLALRPARRGWFPGAAVPQNVIDDPQIRRIRCAVSPLASHRKTKAGRPSIPDALGLGLAPARIGGRRCGPAASAGYRWEGPGESLGRKEVRHAVIRDNSTLGAPRLPAPLRLVVRARQAKACQAPDRDDWPESGHHWFYALSLE